MIQIGKTGIHSMSHADNVVVFWPGQRDPTRGTHNHRQESIEFFKMFPDNHLVNNPYSTSLQRMIILVQ